MNRRNFLSSSAGLASLGLSGALATARMLLSSPADAAELTAGLLGNATPFSRTMLLDEAKKLASDGYHEPPQIPEPWASLPYDQYRDIKFRGEDSLWMGENRGFTSSLLHSGFLYRQAVGVFLVEDGAQRKLKFSADLFDYGPNVKPPDKDEDLGFSGFKLRRTASAAETGEEFVAFQGATYFRAKARDQIYGLSARGLAINTGDPNGEEFPLFERFWIETPDVNASSVVVHALLNSRSCTGVYRFTLRADAETSIDVELSLFPREDMTHVGLGALTSMFLYDATSRTRFDDFRPAVHGSDGLSILTGGGELIWRPLANPKGLQISAFVDQNPRGFGLIQRHRTFDHFSDLNTRYDLKPSCWVEPIGDWGQGAVELIEIPSDSEIHENILCNWRPQAKLPAGQQFTASYRMHWSAGRSLATDLAIVGDTRIGQAAQPQLRRFVIDFTGNLPAPDKVKLELSASVGHITSQVVVPNEIRGGLRVMFDLDTRNIQLAELRASLTDGSKKISETWLYRWTA
jgi:glucans biosynthesis protein